MTTVELQSQDHRDLLDIVDKLRSFGLTRYIDLPQIIVCGDQSTGKSSVLEAISGLSFPTKDHLCTRFATELILRRDETPGVNISVIPRPDRTPEEGASLSTFHYQVDIAHPGLSSVVDGAKRAMSLSEVKVFSSDTLRVELRGPQQPHLTLVNLPGLFRASNRDQSVDSAPVVQQMVRSYMEKPRSIILATHRPRSTAALYLSYLQKLRAVLAAVACYWPEGCEDVTEGKGSVAEAVALSDTDKAAQVAIEEAERIEEK